MTINPIDRRRLCLMDKRCERLARESAAIYHRAVQARVPQDTLSAVARLSSDIAAIQNRIFAMRYPTGGAL
jgi:hypothetical protein